MPEPSEPAYARIAAQLSRRIADRELAPGDKVPSTRQVAQEFGVALATATKALDVLRAEGLVITRPRSGTVVAPRRSPSRSDEAVRELTRERVLAESVAIADAEGLEAVSMRAVAGRCGVAPMSLYRFVEDKEELVNAMADMVYGSAAFERDEAAPWRAQVESLSRELWRLHRAHPWLGRTQPLTRPLPLPSVIRLGDRLLGALEGTGLPPKTYFDVHVLLFSHIVGLAANFEAEDEAVSETGLSSEEWTDLQYLPRFGDEAFATAHPHFAKLFGHFGSLPNGYDMDLEDLFELGLGLMLDGVETLARRTRADPELYRGTTPAGTGVPMSDLHVVLGATGAIGKAVVAELTARGREVRAVSRHAEGPQGFQADITTAEGAIAACKGASVVYQCAQPPYAEWAEEFVGLTDTVLSAVEQAEARLVMADNLYMYGPVEAPMTEDMPYAAKFPKGRARARVAEMILNAHKEGRVRASLGRASDYFGPGGVNTILGPTIFAAAAAGTTARWVGELDEPHTVAYLPDLANGLVTLGEEPTADGYAWHLPAGLPLTGEDFLNMVWKAAGERPKNAGMSRGTQRLIGLFNPVVKELGETWYQRDRPFVSDDSAFRASFPKQVRVTPHERAIAETLAWFRAQA